ncbi:MAG: selenocysteine-specific translation elongation factor [Gemmataceae bacterium]
MAIRDIILGTAGHIDHGKTTLVKALTGIDCDRLPEEKARGITIDLGFANLELDGYKIGIVDVPGHERFVKNMLAGATGFDLAMLIIAADDSAMPQTMEHLEILKLLKIPQGVIVITKCDLVDQETLDLVDLEARELVKGSFLENAPIVQTVASKGIGIDALKNALKQQCDKITAKSCTGQFRMPIDRSFVVQGHGAVVTGTVYSGEVSEGDEIELLPERKFARVRSIQSHAKNVKRAFHGQRCAINLAGVEHGELIRGKELATKDFLVPSKVITVRLHASGELKKHIKHRLQVRLHAGTSEAMGSISLLEKDFLSKSDSGLAQLFLETPVCVTFDQPFVIRNSQGTLTIGGGHIIQPIAIKIRRRHSHSIEMLKVLEKGRPAEKIKAIGWFMGFQGIDLQRLPLLANLAGDLLQNALGEAIQNHYLSSISSSGSREKYLDPQLLNDVESKIIHCLEALHAENPILSTHEIQKVTLQLEYVGDVALIQGIIEGMIKSGVLVGNTRRIGLSRFKPKLSNSQRKLMEKICATYRDAKLAPPDLKDFAKSAGAHEDQLQSLFEICVQEGKIVHLQAGLYLDHEIAQAMLEKVKSAMQPGNGMTVAQIRDLLATSRKYAVPYCEYLDKIGLTKREGDLRFLNTPPGEEGSKL